MLLIQEGFLKELFILKEFLEGWCYDLAKFRLYVTKAEKIILVNYHNEECPDFLRRMAHENEGIKSCLVPFTINFLLVTETCSSN